MIKVSQQLNSSRLVDSKDKYKGVKYNITNVNRRN